MQEESIDPIPDPTEVDVEEFERTKSSQRGGNARGDSKSDESVLARVKELPSPAQIRDAEAVFKRTTRGLIRLGSRRRRIHFLRKLTVILAVALVIAGIGYFAADYLPINLAQEYWERLMYKIAMALGNDPP